MTFKAFDTPFIGNIILTEVKFTHHSDSSSIIFSKVYQIGNEKIRKINNFTVRF